MERNVFHCQLRNNKQMVLHIFVMVRAQTDITQLTVSLAKVWTAIYLKPDK